MNDTNWISESADTNDRACEMFDGVRNPTELIHNGLRGLLLLALTPDELATFIAEYEQLVDEADEDNILFDHRMLAVARLLTGDLARAGDSLHYLHLSGCVEDPVILGLLGILAARLGNPGHAAKWFEKARLRETAPANRVEWAVLQTACESGPGPLSAAKLIDALVDLLASQRRPGVCADEQVI